MRVYQLLIIILLQGCLAFGTRAQTGGTPPPNPATGAPAPAGTAAPDPAKPANTPLSGTGATPDKVALPDGSTPVAPLSLSHPVVGNLIALSPILLHLLLLIWIWTNKVSLKEALSDKETVRQRDAARLRLKEEELRAMFPQSSITTGPNLPDATTLQALIKSDEDLRKRFMELQYASAANAGGTTPTPIASVSRLIVFIAGYAGVAIGTCLASFVIFYRLNTTGETPNLNGLAGVILALGIGVVPYALTRITANNEEPEKPNS